MAAGRSAATQETLSNQFAKTTALLNLLASDSFSMPYDGGPCTVSAGKTDCTNVAGLQAGLLSPLDALRSQIDTFNRAGQNLFATDNTDVLRYLVLWADVVRRQMRYPMDKTTQPAASQKALMLYRDRPPRGPGQAGYRRSARCRRRHGGAAPEHPAHRVYPFVGP